VSTRLSQYLKRHFGIHTFQVMARALGSDDGSPRAVPGFAYRLLDRGEIEACCDLADLRMSRAFVEAAAKRGDACIGALEGGEMAACAWIAFGSVPCAPGVWAQLDERACSIHTVFVRHAWQGQGLERALRLVADDLCLWAGKRFAVSFVDARNAGDIARIAETGARTIARVGFVESLGMNWRTQPHDADDDLQFRFYQPGQAGTEPRWQAGSGRS
jgi:GNAT superfamily N-acetyltransferase